MKFEHLYVKMKTNSIDIFELCKYMKEMNKKTKWTISVHDDGSIDCSLFLKSKDLIFNKSKEQTLGEILERYDEV